MADAVRIAELDYTPRKRTQSDTPLLSWCLIARNDARTIESTFASIRARTPEAEIVVVETHSSDGTWDIAKQWADVLIRYSGPRNDWNAEMPFFDDASAARQKSFEIASGVFRGWIDADDYLPGPERARALLEANGMFETAAPHAKIVGQGKVTGVEETLVEISNLETGADCFYAPYAYQLDAERTRVLVWQSRERIVRWNQQRWGWREAAHEILVPLDGVFPPRVDLHHLVFEHLREFSPESGMYSIKRHFHVLHNQYARGEITSRRCEYLAMYARELCPERELEFITAGHKAARNPLDRYYMLMVAGDFARSRALYYDALEQYGAAQSVMPGLPDAWIRGADIAVEAEDWIRAEEWLKRGLALGKALPPQSRLSPRQISTAAPLRFVQAEMEIARIACDLGDWERASHHYLQASEMAHKLAVEPAVKAVPYDSEEATAFGLRVRNETLGHEFAKSLHNLIDYLFDNDETEKATKVLDVVPHHLEDHPLIIECEKRVRPIVRHLRDPEAYAEFYRNECDDKGLLMPTPAAFLDPNHDAAKRWVPRAHWAATWAKTIIERKGSITILDLGCFDGQSGIPLLKLLPVDKVHYIGVDWNHRALDRFRDTLKRMAMEDYSVELIHGAAEEADPATDVDMVISFEVIEHVADVQGFLWNVLGRMADDGILLLTTPWGAHDNGGPPKEGRDSRSHVRAYTLRTMLNDTTEAGLRPIDAYRHTLDHPKSTGDTMHAAFALEEREGAPVSFAVCAALWDWHGREIAQHGIGASETMIRYLAEGLSDHHPTRVYGPVPEPEVFMGVPYLPRAQLRHAPAGPIVVSRASYWGTTLDEMIGEPRKKILWLQDAYYSDLNPEVAGKYEKVVCVSHWHKDHIVKHNGLNPDQIEVAYNFIRPEMFARRDQIKRKPFHMVYASSPDRGLVYLLHLWPRIRERMPEATLSVYYGWRGCAKLGTGVGTNPDWIARHEGMRKQFEEVRFQPGVSYYSMQPHQVVINDLMSASVWPYPVNFEETCCTLAIEARAAGAVPVTCTTAALRETARTPMGDRFLTELRPLQSGFDDWFIDAIEEATRVTDAERDDMSAVALTCHTQRSAVEFWRRLLREIGE